MTVKSAIKPEAEIQEPLPIVEASRDAAPVFESSQLIESAHLFGVAPEIMAGALVMAKKEVFTRQEAMDAVKAFMVHPVRKG